MNGVRANNFTGGLLLGGLLAILTLLIMGASSHDGPVLAIPVPEVDTDRGGRGVHHGAGTRRAPSEDGAEPRVPRAERVRRD